MVQRIVSLIASATEIVCALGLEKRLVGRSHECDFPPSVRRLPVCTEPKFKTDGTSYEIDQRVKAVLQESLSVYRVDAEKLKELRPDLIVTQSHCEVCAVSFNEVQAAVCEWLGSKPHIVSLEPNSLSDVWHGFKQVAGAAGVTARGEKLVTEVTERMGRIAEKTRLLSNQPSVAYIEWMEPLMAGGNWMPELVEMAGGKNLFGIAGEHSPRIRWEALREKDPDVLFISPCGFDIARSRKEIFCLTKRPGWDELKAVRSGRVYLADGNQYFNRPGPRLAESLEILAEVLHPEPFRFGHEGTGWQVVGAGLKPAPTNKSVIASSEAFVILSGAPKGAESKNLRAKIPSGWLGTARPSGHPPLGQAVLRLRPAEKTAGLRSVKMNNCVLLPPR